MHKTGDLNTITVNTIQPSSKIGDKTGARVVASERVRNQTENQIQKGKAQNMKPKTKLITKLLAQSHLKTKKK